MYNLGVPFSFLSHSLSLSFSLFSAILEKRTVALLVIWISTFLFPHSLLPTSLSFSPLSLSPTSLSCPALNSKPYCCCPQIQPFFNHPHLGSGSTIIAGFGCCILGSVERF